MTDAAIRIEVEAGVMTLTIDRTHKKNAITQAMYLGMAEAIGRAADDADVRVLVLRGEGADFTAGNDLADFADAAAGGAGAALVFLHALARLEKPVVAAVEGRAIGIGMTLLLHCDAVFAASDARLSVPFVDLGLTPEAASSLLLPARIGHARAYAMFALGRAIDGRTAADWGLVTEAVEPGSASASALAAARILAGKPAAALAITKRLMRDAEALAARIDHEGVLFAERLASEEARAAFAAFLGRR
jgi:enoyl-CoA hydratase/carnithine racemase